MLKSKRIIAVAAMCSGLVAVPASAQADEPAATASGSLGSVHMVVNGQPVDSEELAPCAVGGIPQNATNGASFGVIARYGSGQTACARDAHGAASAKVSGRRFETSVLRAFHGPKITVQSYSAQCATTGTGSSANVELGGVAGFGLPENIPPNYTVAIPGRAPSDPPMAVIVLNELVAPTPPDGSLETNALHIKLFPHGGGPVTGDIVVGRATCDPSYGG